MKTTNFIIPETKLITVVWYRNGVKGETLIDRPETNVGLVNVMFNQYRVGPSEIRALKSVSPTEFFKQI